MEPLKTIIIEDNLLNQKQLSRLIREYCPEVQVLATASTVEEAVSSIRDHSPDFIFLDVILPDGNGFDVLNYFNPMPFKVIFVSGHIKYAYEAIKFHAVDFLSKPVKIQDLIDAVKLIAEKDLNDAYRLSIDHAKRQFEDPSRMILHEVSGFTVIETDEIIKLEANGNYTDFYLTGGRKLTYCRILKDFEVLLQSHSNFMRVHKSFLINLNHVRSYSKQGEIKLTDEATANLGDKYRNRFKAYFF
jgi:two-component system LytT family response regulator